VIVGLHVQRRGIRQQRRIEVIKMRGAPLVPGQHGLVIGQQGLVVTPRLESRVGLREHLPQPDALPDTIWNEARATLAAGAAARAAFGLPVFDALLEGGLTRGTSTLLMGHLGVGKTLLGLQFAIAGALAGEPTVFLGFRETYEQLALNVLPFSLGQRLEQTLAPPGPVHLVRWPPVELQADVVADHLLALLDEVGARRLVVDSIAELERAAAENADPARVENFLAALVESLRRRGLTTLFIREVSQDRELKLDLAEEPVTVLAENIVLLRQIEQQGQLRRALSVAKMRFSAYDATTLQEVRIAAPDGLSVLGPLNGETPK
jgi:circadian clock protein KaiC